jgi:multisubunit Na+/H+ antiporter MnhF subunit
LTPVLAVPWTAAFIAVEAPAVSEVVVGLNMTETVGISAMVALAVFVGSTTLFATKVMVCCVASVVGTVYTPPVVTDPTAGFVQVTAVLLAPLTPAENAAD